AMTRSAELIEAMLGVLKAGCAYMPIDATYPRPRIAMMIEEAGTKLIVSQQQNEEAVRGLGAEVVKMEEALRGQSRQTCVMESWSDSLAYVMYTSGSSGRAKGVAITQKNVVKLVKGVRYVEFGEEEVILAYAPVSFDASTFEIWGSVLNGGKVVMMKEQATLEELGEEMRRSEVSMMWMTAGLFHQMVEREVESFRGVRQMLSGGDVVSAEAVRKVVEEARGIRVINGYGPTETTTFASSERVRRREEIGERMAIGRPIENTVIYVLDEEKREVGIGVEGEVWIGGEGVGRGYIGRGEETAEKYEPDERRGRGERMYRSGDRGRYGREGKIEYLGRRDGQVKIRGYRVEVEEVEREMEEVEGIKEAVVEVKEVGGEKRLVGYVVVEEGAEVREERVKEEMRKRMPEWMVVWRVMEVERMPLTVNGKVDRRALPMPDPVRPELEKSFQAPRTPDEELIANIWAQILQVDQVGIYDTFFELGGHSLSATQAISQLKEAFQMEIPLRNIFEFSTVESLARRLMQLRFASEGLEVSPIVAARRDQDLYLSFAQQRLWFMDRLSPDKSGYNISNAIRLKGPLNVPALEQALGEIVRRHEVLRSSFSEKDGQPLQITSPEYRIAFTILDLRNLPDEEKQRRIEGFAIKQANRSFDLSRAPLMRVTLLRLAAEDNVVLFTMHHIVGDAWSVGILIGEVTALYEAYLFQMPSPLEDLPIQYADYAQWQRQWLEGDVLDTHLSYWKNKLNGKLPTMDLPFARPRPTVQTFRGSHSAWTVPKKLSDSIKKIGRQEGATLFMSLMAIFNAQLNYYMGIDDIILGTDVANRTRPETEKLIGFFANQLVLRTDLSGNPTYLDLLGRVREVALGAYAHQNLPFDKLVEALKPQRDFSRNPLFQILFGLHNAPTSALHLPGVTPSSFAFENGTSVFDLSLYFIDTGDGLAGIARYNADLFDGESIARLIADYDLLLEAVATDPLIGLNSMRELLEQTEMNRRKAKDDDFMKARLSKFKSVRRRAINKV
ncbi:MAG: amino acid adenylation domain-containing protein, partial [Blastocatellia bacterium]